MRRWLKTNGTPGIALISSAVLGILLMSVNGCEKSGREAMDFRGKNAGLNAQTPPIDAAAPAKVETATFALG
ncbi:MAG: hypothetical protein M1497_04710 [Nitrospirae bacterium]|nr:hypothetical protein [Nitrospirota bacterium]